MSFNGLMTGIVDIAELGIIKDLAEDVLLPHEKPKSKKSKSAETQETHDENYELGSMWNSDGAGFDLGNMWGEGTEMNFGFDQNESPLLDIGNEDGIDLTKMWSIPSEDDKDE